MVCAPGFRSANLATRCGEAALAPSLRELPNEREAEGVYFVGFYAPKSFGFVGEALSLPQRWILASIQ